jgi:polyisoprenyl-teichoic acid--peptidoglycan teichoic acid transferase
LPWAGLGLIVAAVALAGYATYWGVSTSKKVQLEGPDAKKVEKVTQKPKAAEPITILLVGTDRREGWTTGRADAISLLRLYPDDQKAYLLSVPRDSRVAIPRRKGLDKINHSFAYGGPALLIETVEEFLDVDVNYYVQMDFAAFPPAVDRVGGVVFRGRRLSGKEALATLQNRKYPTGDFQRIKNQQEFLMAAGKQLFKPSMDMPSLAGLAADYTKTNMSVTEMYGVAKGFMGADHDLQVATVPGSTGMIGGVSYVFPDEAAKKRLVTAMLKKRPFFVDKSGP